jgi:hypothetical protein
MNETNTASRPPYWFAIFVLSVNETNVSRSRVITSLMSPFDCRILASLLPVSKPQLGRENGSS